MDEVRPVILGLGLALALALRAHVTLRLPSSNAAALRARSADRSRGCCHVDLHAQRRHVTHLHRLKKSGSERTAGRSREGKERSGATTTPCMPDRGEAKQGKGARG